ncbi:hypothetical protein [Rodentibacter genomosp. 2]|uniref:Uncharacterized protein n=1 Tax=Rodentibacter genomosp. 2 TaxID=1908266 RepID=A0A1V3JAL3_9PAST|nr:hypothetical protein [Rodentibacter genomosp. 2]OOF53589.1 hypothetical protein BKK55_11150 [Rodentibacter genomosp. 2]
MTKVTILRNANKYSDSPKIRNAGKAGRLSRMFEKSRKITALWEKAVVKPSKVDSAISLAGREKKLIDVANYHCTKGKAKSTMVRATQKRQMGCRELVRV